MIEGSNLYVIGTDKCNLKCYYCANSLDRKPEEFKPEEIIETARGIYGQYPAESHHDLGVSGGEPLADMKFLGDILSIYPPNQLHLTLFTNGILFTEDIEKWLKTKTASQFYVVGLDFSEEKSLPRFLSNPAFSGIVKDKRVAFNFVVSDFSEMGQIKKNMTLVVEKGLNASFNFNHTLKNRSELIHSLYYPMKKIVQETGFVPRKLSRLHRRDCKTIVIDRGGWSCYCEREVSEEDFTMFNKFKSSICTKCHCAEYCACCVITVTKRYGWGNYCKWMEALCTNVIGGDCK